MSNLGEDPFCDLHSDAGISEIRTSNWNVKSAFYFDLPGFFFRAVFLVGIKVLLVGLDDSNHSNHSRTTLSFSEFTR